jgi:hypothetical protein
MDCLAIHCLTADMHLRISPLGVLTKIAAVDGLELRPDHLPFDRRNTAHGRPAATALGAQHC